MNLKAKIEDVLEALATDGEVTVRGFGTFHVERMPAREYYVPKTGATKVVPAHCKVRFTPNNTLGKKLDKSGEIAKQIVAVEQQIAALEARYGKGVRPEWVGEDISLLDGRLRQLRAELTRVSS